MQQHLCENKNTGFVALMTVLIVNCIGLIVILSLLSRGGFFADAISSFEGMKKTSAYTDACTESALLLIKSNTDINGSYGLSFPDGYCSYSIAMIGERFSIESSAVSNGYFKKTNTSVEVIDSKLRIVNIDEGF